MIHIYIYIYKRSFLGTDQDNNPFFYSTLPDREKYGWEGESWSELRALLRSAERVKLVMNRGSIKTSAYPHQNSGRISKQIWQDSPQRPLQRISGIGWKTVHCPPRYNFTYGLERDLVSFTVWCSPSCSEAWACSAAVWNKNKQWIQHIYSLGLSLVPFIMGFN